MITDEKVKPKAPGMKYRHYAPNAGLTIVEGSTEQVIKTINEKAVNCRLRENVWESSARMRLWAPMRPRS